MSTELTIPNHLTQFMSKPSSVGSDLINGVSQGGHSKISIKASRFRLHEVDGTETVVPALHLDVYVVAGNPNMSKVFYEGQYQQGMEPSAPACFSDNGIGPSARATKPQCGSCAACPMNAWGSKISPNGAKTKACQDSKRLAVLLADNPTGALYELRVPAASLKDMAAAFRQYVERGWPVELVRFRLSFDPAFDYPKLVFKGADWADPVAAKAIKALQDSSEAKRIIGIEDRVNATVVAIAPPAAAPMLAPPPAHIAAPPAPEPVAPPVAKPKAKKVAVTAEEPVAGVIIKPETSTALDAMLDDAFND